MVNCNPETVSTDYDTSDRLYFEPLTLEDVLEVVARRAAGRPGRRRHRASSAARPRSGWRRALEDAGVPIVGTTPEAIDLAEERGAFGRVLAEAGLPAPKHGTATVVRRGAGASPTRSATRCWCARPTCSAAAAWRSSTTTTRCAATSRAPTEISPEHPVLVDRFLDDAVEIDVDALFDGEELFLGGVMEHIEEAGIHSGDSACALPPITLGGRDIDRIRDGDRGDRPRASACAACSTSSSRSAPTCSTSWRPTRARRARCRSCRRRPASPLAKAAARVMLGATIAELRAEGLLPAAGDGGDLPADAPIAVKEAVLPFNRFRDARRPDVDTVLGPEMQLDRRGHGHRRRLRHAPSPRPRRRRTARCPPGPGLRLGRQPRQAAR